MTYDRFFPETNAFIYWTNDVVASLVNVVNSRCEMKFTTCLKEINQMQRDILINKWKSTNIQKNANYQGWTELFE